MIRLGILGSTRGTCMLAIIEAIQQQKLNAQIEVVISNKSDALILARGQENSIPACFINPNNISRAQYDARVSDLLKTYRVELVALIGYMRILSDEFVDEWQNKIINVHPSLLPKHAGKMDLDVHKSVIDAGEKVSGCSVHYVTKEVDAGPVILQKECAVFSDDTPEKLKARVQELEAQALVDAINAVFR